MHRILCQPLDSDSTSTTETTEQLNTIAIQLLEAWHVEHAKVAQFGQATVDAVNDVQHAKGITLGFGRVWHGTNETSVRGLPWFIETAVFELGFLLFFTKRGLRL